MVYLCQLFGAVVDKIWWRRNKWLFDNTFSSATETWYEASYFAKEIHKAADFADFK